MYGHALRLWLALLILFPLIWNADSNGRAQTPLPIPATSQSQWKKPGILHNPTSSSFNFISGTQVESFPSTISCNSTIWTRMIVYLRFSMYYMCNFLLSGFELLLYVRFQSKGRCSRVLAPFNNPIKRNRNKNSRSCEIGNFLKDVISLVVACRSERISLLCSYVRRLGFM